MRRAGGRILQATAALLVAVALGPASAAVSAQPLVTIASPLNDSISNNPTPEFSGAAQELGTVLLVVHAGATTAGPIVREQETDLILSGTWLLEPLEHLADGTYTAQAKQGGEASTPVTFTVDTAPPVVTLNPTGSPTTDPTPSFTGTASDITPVTVAIHSGATKTGPLVSRATATGTGGGWASDTASPALAVGQYTAVATQPSSIGNGAGMSAPVSFTVVPIPPVVLSPPAASFKWIPSSPHTGETVTLVSTSTDADAAITASAWALAGNGVFAPGESTVATSFSSPGAHVVQLRVLDAAGLSSVAARTIEVTTPPPSLMAPFPIVRMLGFFSASATRIGLLSVLVPIGTTVRVTCRGGGCPARSERLVAGAGSGRDTGTVRVRLRRFERTLGPGAVLGIWVYRDGRIGKYTRFVMHRGRPPTRTDLCLNAAGTTPLACP